MRFSQARPLRLNALWREFLYGIAQELNPLIWAAIPIALQINQLAVVTEEDFTALYTAILSPPLHLYTAICLICTGLFKNLLVDKIHSDFRPDPLPKRIKRQRMSQA